MCICWYKRITPVFKGPQRLEEGINILGIGDTDRISAGTSIMGPLEE